MKSHLDHLSDLAAYLKRTDGIRPRGQQLAVRWAIPRLVAIGEAEARLAIAETLLRRHNDDADVARFLEGR